MLNTHQLIEFFNSFTSASASSFEMSGIYATVRSAIKLSGVSPLRCETNALYLFSISQLNCLKCFSNCSYLVELNKTEFATPLAIPSVRMALLVQKRSSPTISILFPKGFVRFCHPAQSFSANPSSRSTIGY